jgi:DDE superfamily endonuclease
MFKESKFHLNTATSILADTGYQGIFKINSNAIIPHKKKRNTLLTYDQKDFNHKLSSKRICIENVFAILKRFKIISCKYRNRRRRFGLRFNLIAGFYNYELKGI